jgi:hypothetical protein
MTMRKSILILSGVGVAWLSFVVGRWWGDANASERLMHEEMSRWDKFAALDTNVLQSFPARRNTLASGAYLMDRWFVGHQRETWELALRCENGQVTVLGTNSFNRSRAPQSLSVNGNVISWSGEGILYEANEKYVGLIDGSEIRGRVYGWNPGDESIGLWRIYPKPLNSEQNSGVTKRSQPLISEHP